MAAGDDDWRLTGQGGWLTGAELSWRTWSPPEGENGPCASEHDHCAFCWAKFVAGTAREQWRQREDGRVAAGYASTHPLPDGGSAWVCARCFGDFHERFAWTVVPEAERSISPEYRSVVELTVRALPREAQDRLVSALHDADHSVGIGGTGKTLLTLFAGGSDPALATSTVLRALADAAVTAGLDGLLEDVVVTDVSRSRLSPGRPQLVASPPLTYREVALADGTMLAVAYEGPCGNWIVRSAGSPDQAWSGRGLRRVLTARFGLPRLHRENWVDDLVRQLAGHETSLGIRFACPCCDHLTLSEAPSGTFASCRVCVWEDDCVQFADLDYAGGANGPSLRQARENVRRSGVSQERLRSLARPALPEELP